MATTTTPKAAPKRATAKPAAAKATGPAKKAAAKPSAKHTHCPLCGFEFKTPKAKCSDANACAKRAAERKAAAKVS